MATVEASNTINVENIDPITGLSPKKIKLSEPETAAKLVVRFKRLTEAAHAPTYGSSLAAGADLYAAEDGVVPPRGKLCVSTGLQVAIPPNHYGRVAPRSGLAAKNFIDVGAGVVDADYRGELKVLLFNFNDQEFTVKTGDRIAQFICEKISHVTYEESTELDDTARGAGGFGSTGV